MSKLSSMGALKDRLFGAFVAIVTPFKSAKNGCCVIDWDALTGLIDWLIIGEEVDGIVVGGCTGESFTLTHAEQKKLFAFVVKQVNRRVLVVAGTGSNSTEEAIKLTRHAAKVGVDYAMLICPYANKPTAEGMKVHFFAVAKSVPDLPIMLYNVPSRTGVNISPQTIAWLYDNIENIIAIKEAGGSLEQVDQILQLCDITVLSGDDALTLPMMAAGAKGVVSVAANIVPEKISRLCNFANEGDFASARRIHSKLIPLFKALFIETNPMPVKAALARMGLIKNMLRLPLVPILPEKADQLYRVMDDLEIKTA